MTPHQTPAGETQRETASTDGTRDTYNFEHFGVPATKPERNVTAGEEAVDVTLYTLDGDTVDLADLWAENPVVVEFGSITCPVFTNTVETMDALADRYAGDVDFYVVYTREAHPGQHYPAHRTLDEKRSNAADACDLESVDRTVLVDDVAGTMHTQYTSLPNAVYLIGTDGVVAHQADWLDPSALEDAIETLLENEGRGTAVTPTSLTDNYEKPTRATLSEMYRVFSRAGPGSLRDFLRTMPRLLLHRIRERHTN